MSTAPGDHPDDKTAAIGGEHEQTGHTGVDAALERLRDVDDLPVADHVEVYDEVQQRLAAAMDDSPDRRRTPDAG